MKKFAKTAGIIFLAFAVLCFLAASGGFLWCYACGFRPTDLVPALITTAIFGAIFYGAIGGMLLLWSSGPRGGGRRQKRRSKALVALAA